MIAAIYARKSTDQNVADEEKSVTRQVECARAYATSKGWAVTDAHVYIDDGISGAEFEKRPGYVALMASLTQRPPFQVLILMDQSRLGRSTREIPYALGRIMDAGVRVFCYLTDSEIQGATETDQFMLAAMAYVDGMHREQAVQRTRDAMRRKAERGHVAGGTVYGYTNQRVADHVERVPVPAQAEVIRRIFRDVAKGDGFCRIAKGLNAEGIPSPTRRGWAISGVRELVMRELYRGRQVYGRTRWERRKGTKRKVQVPASEWLTAEVPALRIVDEALWEAAHRRLAETRAVYARLTDGRLIGRPEGHVESPYLFTGFLRCKTCGGTVQVAKQPSRGTVLTYYRCATLRERGETRCATGVRARLSRLEAAILATLERDVLAEDVLIAVMERTIARQVAAAAQQPGRRAVVAGELAEVRVRIGRYVEALGAGVAVEEIRGQLSVCKLREQVLLGELAERSPLIAPLLDRAKLRARLLEWHGLLRQTPQVARQLLRKLLPEPILLEPVPEGVHFRGRAAWGALLSGVLQGTGLVVPPG